MAKAQTLRKLNACYLFCRLLVEAGAALRPYDWLAAPHLPQSWRDDSDVQAFLHEESTAPPPLKRQVRTFIYSTFRVQNNKDIRPLIKQLQLPPLIMRYLLLERALANAVAYPPNHLTPIEMVAPPPR